jgi:hypothetical protein
VPDRYCPTCRQPVPAAGWVRHRRRHQQQASPRQGTTPGHRAQRERVLERAHHRCERCGAAGPLELHHTDRDWRNHTDDTRVAMLCHDCHVETFSR